MSVGIALDSTELICPHNDNTSISQSAQRFFIRVPIGVISTNADDSIGRSHGSKELIAGAGIAAVMTNTENICGNIGPGIQEIVLGFPLSITSDEE